MEVGRRPMPKERQHDEDVPYAGQAGSQPDVNRDYASL